MKRNSTLRVITLTFSLLVMGVITAFAQRTISGTITDAETGEGLIGANVVVKGTTVGTSTDFDGNYTLNIPEDATTLVLSYTGYSDKDVPVGESNVINATMSFGETLDEVVVVGYGTQRREEITSSVVKVDAKEFNKGNINSPTQLIQGKVAGLNISQVGADPNSNPEIRLRGVTTFGANAEPLVVIDGVIGVPLDLIDPNDIESFDVLKDGSASAIYGTRASSGVILVTTKSGEYGAPKVEYNGWVSTESVAERVPTMSADRFRQVRPDSDRGASTNWIDEVTRNALSHNHNLSVSGGTESSKYRVSVSYRDIQGVGNQSENNRYVGRLRFSQKALNDKLKLDFNIGAARGSQNFGFNEAFRYATTYNPTAPVLGGDLADRFGGYYQEINFDYFNPVAIQDQNFAVGQFQGFILNAQAKYNIMDNLSVATNVSQSNSSGNRSEYYGKQSFWRGEGANGLARTFENSFDDLIVESTINYKHYLDNNTSFELLAGHSWQEVEVRGTSISAGDFISDEIGVDNLGFSLQQVRGEATIGSFRNVNRIIGFFGRANLNVDDTYYLSGSLRRDGSSRFGPNNRWGLFGGVSAGVTLSNLLDIKGVDNLKLRVGYGVTGANAPADNLFLLTFGRQGNFFNAGSFVPAIGPTQNANPDLKWEVKREINAGLDIGFGNFSATVDYFTRTTSDLLFNVPVSAQSNNAGFTWANLQDVELRNSGVELVLEYQLKKENFTWKPGVVFGTLTNQLDRVEAPEDSEFTFFAAEEGQEIISSAPGAPGLNNRGVAWVRPGESLGLFYAPISSGVDESGNFIYDNVDADGNGVPVVLDGVNAIPDFSLGIKNEFNIGNLDFSFFLRGDFGHELANMWRTFYEPLGSRNIENLVETEFFNENLTQAPEFNDTHIESASFLLLDNATIGYNFELPEDGTFSNVRLWVSGRNLFTITNYSGADPSVRWTDPGPTDNGGFINTINNPLAPGIDRRNNYFRTRAFSLGASIGF